VKPEYFLTSANSVNLFETFKQQLEGKSILIIGANGLIGINLASLIASLQIKTIKLSLISSSEISPLLENTLARTKYTYKKANLALPEALKSEDKADYVIFAAGYGQPAKFLTNKTSTILLNTLGLSNAIATLKEGGSLLYLSSSEVYSGLEESQLDETKIGCTPTNHPRSSYIEAKRCGEALCYANMDSERKVKIARLALAYGPGFREDDQRVLHELIMKGLRTGVINLKDDGSAFRTYIYIDDAVRYLLNILVNGREALYNVSGDSETTISGLARLIANNLNIESTTKNTDAGGGLKGAPTSVSTSPARYCAEFGDYPRVNLTDGIDRCIKYAKTLLRIE